MGKTVFLLLLIIAVAAGGLLWFDYLGIVDIKTSAAPVYRFFGLQGRTQNEGTEDELLNLDAERLAVRLEALDLRSLEMDKERQDIEKNRLELDRIAAELETRQKGLDEREQSITTNLRIAEVKDKNADQFARYLNGMPPQSAVAIITAMDDQAAIDVLRKTEEIAKAEGTSSIVPFWLSLMPAERAADLQRKMAERP
ncbi:MAG: flagellar protein FlbB [Spirochaetaceae bacterium]|jgi:flagellar protein FlbB|nr:flagellar protein FlbB [Spirochaetaceae bacterium]